MCSFCREFDEERNSSSRIIWENDDSLLLPTVGCLKLGYCLFMPMEHVKSFASLPQAQIEEAFSLVEKQRKLLEIMFGQTIIAEHGSGGYSQKGASCCDHAHLHLIPMPNQVNDVYKMYKLAGGKPIELKTLSDLSKLKNQPYMLLSPKPGIYQIWTQTENFPRQFIRRVVAELIGVREKFDWRDHHFNENMKITQDTLCEITLR